MEKEENLSYLINEIEVENENFEIENSKIESLNKVNIFIGENNSGKSRFIREVLLKNFQYKDKKFKDIYNELVEIKEKFKGLFEEVNHPILCFSQKLEENDTADNFLEYYKQLKEMIKKWLNPYQSKTFDSTNHNFPEISKFLQENLIDVFDKQILDLKFINYKKVYIPILRGLRPILLSKKWR
jgi:hypothetical protein